MTGNERTGDIALFPAKQMVWIQQPFNFIEGSDSQAQCQTNQHDQQQTLTDGFPAKSGIWEGRWGHACTFA